MKWILVMLFLLAGLLGIESAGFQVRESFEEVPERGVVTRFLIESSAGKFALNPPATWGVQIKKQEECVCFELDQLGALLAIRFSTNAPPRSAKEVEKYFESRWPGARVTETYGVFTRDGEGNAAECLYRSAAATPYRARVAFVRVGSATVEFTLTAPEEWPQQLHNVWTTVLNSFEQTPGRKGPNNVVSRDR